jgi:hypothetical protein
VFTRTAATFLIIKSIRFCSTSLSKHISRYITYEDGHLLRAPVLYNTCQEGLLWIVSYVWSNAIYSTSKMSIRTTHNLRCGHAWFERFKNLCKRRMQKLAAKLTEFCIISIFFFCYKFSINHIVAKWNIIMLTSRYS